MIVYIDINAWIMLYNTVWHENFTVVKFYGSPLNCLEEKLLGF